MQGNEVASDLQKPRSCFPHYMQVSDGVARDGSTSSVRSVTIQGEPGSNSHMAAAAMLPGVAVVACAISSEALNRVLSGEVDGAVLPIENTLHGSVMEHYDLLVQLPVTLIGESRLRIAHYLLAFPGSSLADVRTVMSHPVALSQCRRWLAAHPEVTPVPFYDTAGSLKQIMTEQRRDAAAIAPKLAAEVYGGEVLASGIEDHAENFTRFHLIVREALANQYRQTNQWNKMTIAFAVEHRPGTLVAALQAMAQAGADLTRIESRPVQGRPWEYIFYTDLRFAVPAQADVILAALWGNCRMVKELGRYAAAE